MLSWQKFSKAPILEEINDLLSNVCPGKWKHINITSRLGELEEDISPDWKQAMLSAIAFMGKPRLF